MENIRLGHGELVLVPSPFQGHINPMFDLGSILNSRGFSITVVQTGFNSSIQSNYPNFTFLPISHSFTSSSVSSENFITFFSSLNESCEAPLQGKLSQMIKKDGFQGKRPCIIYDEYMYFAEAVASNLKLPSIIYSTSSAANLLTIYVVLNLRKEGCFPLQDSKSTDIFPGLHPLRFKDLPASTFDNTDPLMQLLAEACNTRSSSAVILNTIDCLEPSPLSQLKKRYQIPIFAIGPMHKAAATSSTNLSEEQSKCITWLDKQNPNTVIYISLGSIAFMDKKELTEMAYGLEKSKQPFLWVVRTGSNNDSSSKEDFFADGFLERIGERGCVVKWAPQKQVLAHNSVGGFWSHCGWNSSLESVSEGVAMICRPCFGDQKLNARYLSEVWKVGLEVESEFLDREEVERAVRRVMVDKEGEEMRLRATKLKKEAELGLKIGGSSHVSLNQMVEFIMSL